MTDFADTDTLSTEIDTDSGPAAGGGGQVVDQAPEPTSVRADLEAAFREDAEKVADKPADDAKEAGKPEDDQDDKSDDQKADKPEAKEEAKPDRVRAEDGKFAKPEAKEEQKEGRRFVEAPQSFLPHAKEVWRNTPHAVQAEVARLVQEQAAAGEQTREVVQRYEGIRQYDELARTNGRDLSESLAKMQHVETLLQSNPLAGLNAILMEIGPRKADGQPFSLYEVAQFVAQQEPQSYQQMVAQSQQPAKPQEDPRIGQLQQQLVEVQERTAQQTIVEPFRASHPRFDALEQDIAFFLQSGRIPESLSPTDRLAAAYDMAERINPPSHADDTARDPKGPAEQRRADDDFSGSKSIKSSPGSVEESFEPQAKSGESVRDSLRAEMRRLNR